MLLGAKDFIDDIKQKYYDKTIIKEMPQVKELFLDKSSIEKNVCHVYQIDGSELMKSRRGNHNEVRNLAICLTRKYAGASLKDIGSRFDMKSFSSVSSVIVRIKQVMDRDKDLRQRITVVEKLLT